jgi:hypothetical protein
LLLLLLLLLLLMLLLLLRMVRLWRLRGALHLLLLRWQLLWFLGLLELLPPLVRWLLLPRGRLLSLVSGCGGGTSSSCAGVCPLARNWSVPFRGICL